MVSALLSPPSTIRRHGPVALLAGAVSVAAAGAVHMAVVPSTWRSSSFRAVLRGGRPGPAGPGRGGAAPTGSAAAAERRAAEVLLALLWWVSRTTGLPVGPEPWAPSRRCRRRLCVASRSGRRCWSAWRCAGRPVAAPVRTPMGIARRRGGGGGDVRGRWDGLSGMPVAASANAPGLGSGRPVAALVAAPGPDGSRRSR